MFYSVKKCSIPFTQNTQTKLIIRFYDISERPQNAGIGKLHLLSHTKIVMACIQARFTVA